MTFREVLWAMDGWDIKAEADMRERWELARLGWYYSVVSHSGKRNLSPGDLLRFPWEKRVVKITDIDKEILNSFPERWPN